MVPASPKVINQLASELATAGLELSDHAIDDAGGTCGSAWNPAPAFSCSSKGKDPMSDRFPPRCHDLQAGQLNLSSCSQRCRDPH
jgi:hypothetical protein